jgi:hypothetical protein
VGAVAVGCPCRAGDHLGLAQIDVPALGDAAAEDLVLVAQPLDGQPQFQAELRKIGAAQVAEFDVLEIVPHPLSGIEFGRLAGELFQREPGGGPLGQEVFPQLRAVDRGPVPDDQQRPRPVPQQMAQKSHDLRTAERALAYLEQQSAVQRQPADRGEVIMGQQRVQDRGLPAGRIGSDDPGQGIQGGLVYPDEGTPLALGFA